MHLEQWLREDLPGYGSDGRWYVGRPLLVTSNDYQLRLFNGDTGVVVDVDGAPRAAFRRDGRVVLLPVSRLSEVATVHAMSVHRSQGSQFARVTLVLPPPTHPLLTRELLYTAVTRAKHPCPDRRHRRGPGRRRRATRRPGQRAAEDPGRGGGRRRVRGRAPPVRVIPPGAPGRDACTDPRS